MSWDSGPCVQNVSGMVTVLAVVRGCTEYARCFMYEKHDEKSTEGVTSTAPAAYGGLSRRRRMAPRGAGLLSRSRVAVPRW